MLEASVSVSSHDSQTVRIAMESWDDSENITMRDSHRSWGVPLTSDEARELGLALLVMADGFDKRIADAAAEKAAETEAEAQDAADEAEYVASLNNDEAGHDA